VSVKPRRRTCCAAERFVSLAFEDHPVRSNFADQRQSKKILSYFSQLIDKLKNPSFNFLLALTP
jgi:hypothetical protein